MSKETGGPAFPREDYQCNGGFGLGQEGVSLRDYFAARAMQGILSNPGLNIDAVKRVVRDAYKVADAMLEARNKQ
ncbi:hypothetical protein [Lonsdalea quercina]|uniref:hypothetical protein n=1 Tax=Lonsdalea quercina TaxID=71657 RepID=UPI003975993B